MGKDADLDPETAAEIDQRRILLELYHLRLCARRDAAPVTDA